MCSWILKMSSGGVFHTYLGTLFLSRLFSLWKFLCPVGIFPGVTCSITPHSFYVTACTKGVILTFKYRNMVIRSFQTFFSKGWTKPVPSGFPHSLTVIWSSLWPFWGLSPACTLLFCLVGTKTNRAFQVCPDKHWAEWHNDFSLPAGDAPIRGAQHPLSAAAANSLLTLTLLSTRPQRNKSKATIVIINPMLINFWRWAAFRLQMQALGESCTAFKSLPYYFTKIFFVG